MENLRRIAVRLSAKETLVNMNFNQAYANKINAIIQREGISKTKFALDVLKKNLQTNDINELKERIKYGANSQNIPGQERSKTGNFCKMIIKREIDSY